MRIEKKDLISLIPTTEKKTNEEKKTCEEDTVIDEEDDVQLSREELRKARLNFFNNKTI